jgi:hypothetical protein
VSINWSRRIAGLQHSPIPTLANFRLHAIRQENIFDAGSSKPGKKTAYENEQYTGTSADYNFNSWIDELHPSHGSWWFFPMDTLPDYSTLDPQGYSVAEEGTVV